MAEQLLRWCWPLVPFRPGCTGIVIRESGDVMFDRRPRECENIQLSAETLPKPGNTVRLLYREVWNRFEYRSYYVTTDADQRNCQDLFPDSELGDPPWLQIQAELVAAGSSSSELITDTALTLLNRLKAARKSSAPTSSTPRRDAAERRMIEGSESIHRDNAQIAKAVGAFDRLLKLIESNPVDDPWRGNAGLALMPAQEAGREAFGYSPLEFVRDDFSEEFKNRQELIPNSAQEWLLRLNFPDGEPTAFRLGWHGELEMPPNTSPGEFLRPAFARLRPDIVGCLKQWLIEFSEWRSPNDHPTEDAALSISARANRQGESQYVRLDQMAAAVNRSKKTLERLKSSGKLPAPAVEGGGGKPDEWHWHEVRPILETEYGKKLPDRFPSLRKPLTDTNGH